MTNEFFDIRYTDMDTGHTRALIFIYLFVKILWDLHSIKEKWQTAKPVDAIAVWLYIEYDRETENEK